MHMFCLSPFLFSVTFLSDFSISIFSKLQSMYLIIDTKRLEKKNDNTMKILKNILHRSK